MSSPWPCGRAFSENLANFKLTVITISQTGRYFCDSVFTLKCRCKAWRRLPINIYDCQGCEDDPSSLSTSIDNTCLFNLHWDHAYLCMIIFSRFLQFILSKLSGCLHNSYYNTTTNYNFYCNCVLVLPKERNKISENRNRVVCLAAGKHSTAEPTMPPSQKRGLELKVMIFRSRGMRANINSWVRPCNGLSDLMSETVYDHNPPYTPIPIYIPTDTQCTHTLTHTHTHTHTGPELGTFGVFKFFQ